MSKQSINLGTLPNDGTGDYMRLAGKKINDNFDELYSGRANVKDFGAKGDGVTDDTDAINAAIEWAYNNGIATVYMPSGRYHITDVIWLDAPGNTILHWGDPPNAQFSLRLVGDGWGGGEMHGTYITRSTPGTAIVVGPGQYMGVKGIAVSGPAVSWRSQLTGGVGINIMGSGGGAHAVNIEDCQISYFVDGIAVGQNVGTMGDSNTIARCQIAWCKYGVHLYGSQNFINAIYDCTFQNNKWCFYSNYNQFVNVIGGNFSTWGGLVSECVHFTPISGWESQLYEGMQGHFSIQLTSIESGYSWQVMEDADCFCMEHPVMGFISFKKVAWDNVSHILTLELDTDNFGGNELRFQALYYSPSWLIDFINGSPTPYLYAGEVTIVFGTNGVRAKGLHFESYMGLVTILDARGGWNLGTEIKLEDSYLNYMVGGGLNQPKTSREYAYGALCLVTPIIYADQGIVIEKTNMTGLWRLVNNSSSPRQPRRFRDYNGWWFQPLKPVDGTYPADLEVAGLDYGLFLDTPMRGAGQYETKSNYLTDLQGTYVERCDPQISRSPYHGHFPAPWTVPRMTPDMLERYLQPLPDITADDANRYAPVCGDCIYQVTHIMKDLDGDSRAMFVRFKHRGWSWGRDFDDMTWEIPAGMIIPQIKFGGVGTEYLFAGLTVLLDHGPPNGVIKYILTGKNEGAGGERIWRCTWFDYWHGGGFSGTGVGQEPFDVTRLGNQHAAALTDANVAGKIYKVGDIIWQKNPTGGGSMGWMCTTAGVAGVDAVFKAMPNLAS